MQVLEAIKTRSSIGKVAEQRPSREEIEKLLEAAIRAPNHYVTNPWRFFVVAGEARNEFGEIMAQFLAKKMADPNTPEAQDQLRRERAKPLRAPVLIIVGCSPTRDGKTVEIEEICATAAAVQNILLAVTEMGLGAQWRTGDIAYDVSIKRWLGLRDDDHVVSIIFLGYPAMTPRQSPRKPVSELTKWMGWNE